MSNTIKLNDGSEFEFQHGENLNIDIIQKVANLSEVSLNSLVAEAGVKFDSEPTKLNLISCLDEIDSNTLEGLYIKYKQV